MKLCWRLASSVTECHTHGPLCRSNVFLHHLFMCFSAQTIRPPDRKSPSGYATDLLPKSYIIQLWAEAVATTEYVAMCFLCLFQCLHSLWSVGLIRFWLLLFPLIPACFSGVCLWRLRVHMFLSPKNLCFILQYLFSVMWFKQFILNQQRLLFPSHWNVLDCKRCRSMNEWLGSCLWLVKDEPLLHTPCLPSSSLCMARLDDSLPPGSSLKIPPSSAEQRPCRKSGNKV